MCRNKNLSFLDFSVERNFLYNFQKTLPTQEEAEIQIKICEKKNAQERTDARTLLFFKDIFHTHGAGS